MPDAYYKLVFVDGAICPTCKKPLRNGESMYEIHKGHVDGEKWIALGLAERVAVEFD